jgi:hypothetical protein
MLPTERSTTVLEAALHDVHAILVDVLAAADEQYAAVAAGDRVALEMVTLKQERLAARLARAEAQRSAALAGRALDDLLAALPATDGPRLRRVSDAIGQLVVQVRDRNARNADVLRKAADLTALTVQFLQRLLGTQAQPYSPAGVPVRAQSLLVDSRA